MSRNSWLILVLHVCTHLRRFSKASKHLTGSIGSSMYSCNPCPSSGRRNNSADTRDVSPKDSRCGILTYHYFVLSSRTAHIAPTVSFASSYSIPVLKDTWPMEKDSKLACLSCSSIPMIVWNTDSGAQHNGCNTT